MDGKAEPNKAMERSRLLGAEAAKLPLRQATGTLIMTLAGKKSMRALSPAEQQLIDTLRIKSRWGKLRFPYLVLMSASVGWLIWQASLAALGLKSAPDYLSGFYQIQMLVGTSASVLVFFTAIIFDQLFFLTRAERLLLELISGKQNHGK